MVMVFLGACGSSGADDPPDCWELYQDLEVLCADTPIEECATAELEAMGYVEESPNQWDDESAGLAEATFFACDAHPEQGLCESHQQICLAAS